MQECIEPSDAVERMRKCFEDMFGFLVIQVGTIITSQQLNEVLQELSVVELPPSYCRVFFYYFGHGTEEALCLADENVERKHIIGRLQSMCPSHPVELFKIFLFDSCRTTTPNTQGNATPKGSMSGELGYGGEQTRHTFVINATDFNCKAYYVNDEQIHGCGLATLYFTELAPKMNASLSDVLTKVREKVLTYIETHPGDEECCTGHRHFPQVLVNYDRLTSPVNLLAESKGNGTYPGLNKPK